MRTSGPVGVQRLLVGVGAFLVSVAVIGFLAFSWSVAGLGVRSLIVAGVTAAVVGLAVVLRRTLPSTGEAVGALAVVLLLCDVWAARATGLSAATAPSLPAYLAGSLALVGVGLLASALLSGLVAWAASGGSLLVLAGAAAAFAVVDGGGMSPTWLLVLPAVAGAVALAALDVVLAQLDDGQAGAPRLDGTARLDGTPRLDGAPRLARAARLAAACCYVLLLVPAAFVAAWQGAALLSFVSRWWQVPVGSSVGEVSDLLWDGGDVELWAATSLGVTLAAVSLLWPSAAWTRTTTARVGQVLVAGVAVALWSLAPDLPVAAAVAAFALLAVGSALLAVGPAPVGPASPRRQASGQVSGQVSGRASGLRQALLVVAVVAAAVMLLIAWTVRPLSVPVTAATGTALLVVRLTAARSHGSRTALAVTGALGVLVALTVAPAWLGAPADGVPYWAVVTTVAALVLAFGPYVGNRAAFLVTVLTVHGCWIVATYGQVPDADDTLAVVWALTAVLTVVTAVRGPRVVPAEPGALLGVSGAFAVPVVLTVAASSVLAATGDLTDRDRSLVAAVVVLVCALVLAGLILAFGLPVLRLGRRRVAAEVGLLVMGTLSVVGALVDGALDGSGSGAGESLWLPLLLTGVAAAAVASTPGRSAVRLLSWALLTGSWWARLQQTDLAIEVYTVPPALALLGLGVLRLRARRGDVSARADAARPVAAAVLPALSLALLPSLWASRAGSPTRTVALLALAGLLVVVATAPVPRQASRVAQAIATALAATGVVLALSAALIRAVARPDEDVEWYGLAAAAVLVVVMVSGRDLWPGLSAAVGDRSRGLAGTEPLVVVPRTVSGLLAAAGLGATVLVGALGGYRTEVRAAATEGVAVLATIVAAALLLGPDGLASRLGADRRAVRDGVRDGVWAGSALAVAFSLVAAAIGVFGADGGGWFASRPADVWTFPAGLALVAFGATVLRRREELGSWPTLGPGTALVLTPSLLIAVSGDGWAPGGLPGDGVRGVVLVLTATLCVGMGARARLAAPFVLGLTALVWYAIDILGPSLADLWRDAPPWLVLGLAGAVLLYLGATAERRLKDVAAARARLAAMR